MRGIVEFLSPIGRAGVVMVSAVACFPSLLVRKSGLSSLFDRLYATGIRALPVVTVVALFTGMILSLQVGIELSRFSQESYLGAAVMISLVRDGAAFSCGICLAACVGSAIAAEIGTMKVNDEIDALIVMDIPPMRFLAAPRVMALVMMAPLLMFYCCIVGAVGGGLVGATQLNVNFQQFAASAMSVVKTRDLAVGLLKSAVFGLLIGSISVSEGFGTELGATGVGKATQRAVIASFLAILIFGYMITRVCYQ